MAELKDVFQGVLVKALNLPEAEVSSLFTEDGGIKDDAQDTILARHADAVKKQRDAAKAERDQQFARGVREKAEEWEKALKAAGVDLGDAKGEEAVQKLKDHIAAQAKPSDLDDDKVKASPLFRKREKELIDQLTAKEKEHSEYITKRDAEEQRKSTIAEARKDRDDLVKTLKPILPEDPEKQRRLLSVIDQAIEAHTYQTEGDLTYVYDAKGVRKETPNGVPLTRQQFLEAEIRATYDLPVSEAKGSMGDPTKGTVTKSAVKLQKPATRKAYADLLHDINNDPSRSHEEKAALSKEIMEANKDLA